MPATSNASVRNGAHGNTAHEERSRLALVNEANAINWLGHDVLDAEGKVVQMTSTIKEHEEKSPDQTRIHSREVMKYTFYLFMLICVYGLDVLLFGATAEYIVSLISGSWLLVLLGKYLVPLIFLGIEVFCSIKMNEARKERDEAHEEEGPIYGW